MGPPPPQVLPVLALAGDERPDLERRVRQAMLD